MARLTPGALAASLLLGGCSGADGPARSGGPEVPESERYGGTAVVGFLAEAQSMNEFVSADANSDALQSHVLFTTPLRFDPELRAMPYLAERWDTTAVEGDRLALTFELHRGVRWHDGVPTTAHDLKFTFDRIRDPATAYPHVASFELYDSAAVRDSFRVTFYLRRHAGFLDPWPSLSPMPEHILGGTPAADLRNHPFGTRSPVGNGPFRFVEHLPGDRWIFEANRGFADALGGRPYVDRLVYRVIPEPTTMLSEFVAGAVDVYLFVQPGQIDRLRRETDARLITYPSRLYTFIGWNSRRPLFRDPAVRRALTLGIDRAEIIEVVRSGLGELAEGPVPPWHWAHHAELEPLPYDPETARQLLRQAGWIDRDGDGVRERDGARAAFELKTNPNRAREDIMTMVQADLAEIGVEVRTRVQDPQSLLPAITSPERDFDAIVLGWETSFRIYDRDRSLFVCSAMEGPYQFASYCNPRVDEILGAVAGIEDRSRARPLWHEYQEILQRDQPFTFLFYDVPAHAVRDRVRGVEMDIRGPLAGVARWWITPDRRSRTGPEENR